MLLFDKDILICSPLIILTACTGGASDAPADVASAAGVGQIQQQARSWQARSWQARSWQARSWQGVSAAVSSVTRVAIGGTPVSDLHLEGTVLSGTLGGQAIAGADFIGATVTQQDVDGSVFDSTITNVQVDAQDPSGEILLYSITAYNPATGTVENICNPDHWGGQYAMPVYGTWDTTGAHLDSSTQFMFGCTAGVVAKCIRWGYKPWKSVSGRSLASYHQACTRMARADYCGDGVTHTQDDTLIDVYDDLGIQRQSPPDLSAPLTFDAAWTTQGAYCMTKDRWLILSSLASVTLDCKSRFLSLFPLIETSPVSGADVCTIKREDVPRSSVHIDNQSGINISLQ